MAIGISQAFRTQNLRLLGNLFDKNNFLGKKGYYLSSDEDGTRWIADPNETSGVFSGGILSATIGGTTFNVSAGVGQVVSRTVLASGEVETTTNRITWNAQNNVSLTYRTTQKFSYIYIDENGVLQQQSNTFTDSQYRNQIVLGVICHINLSTINLVTNKQNVVYGDSHRLYELMSTFGPIKRSGLAISAYNTGLRVSRSSGTVLLIGSNYITDQFEPDSPTINAAAPASICRVYRNGGGNFIFDTNNGSYYTDIDPAKYDNNSGTLQTVNNNQWTVQRLFFFPSNPNDIIIYYGFGVYNSLNDAFLAIENESFYEAQITVENAVFLGYILVRGGATNLSLITDARFIQAGISRNVIVGGGGAAGLVLDDLLDVQITSPSDSQFFVYENSTSLWKNATFNVVDPLVFTKSGTSLSLALNYASATQPGGVSIGTQTFAGSKTFKDNVIVSGNLTVNGTTVTINSSTLSVDDKNIELGSVVAIPSLSATVNIDAGDTNVTVSSTSGLIVGQALTKISGTGAFGANPVISSITSATQFTVSPVHATTGSIVFSVGGATDVTADGGGITLKGTTDKTIIWVDSTDAWTLSEHLNIASGKSYRINGTDVLSSTTLGSGVINSSLTSVGTLTNLTVTNAITGSVSGSAGSLSGTYTFWGQSFNGTQNVSGNLTSVGNITGTGGITITAGGSNQNVVLTPSGTGYTLLNGNVGIGTSSPAAPLDVVGSSLTAILRNTSATNYAGLRIFNDQNSAFRALEIDYAGSSYSGALITGGPTGESAAIVTTGAYPLSLGTNNNARLTILSGGNVGIGTTSPGNKLEVNGLSGATIQAIFQNSSTSGNYAYNGGIQLGNASNNQNSQIYHTSDGDNTLTFVSNYSSGTGNKFVFAPGGTERVRFQQNGNVGIGHTSPSNKLAVSGSSSIGSNYNIAAPTNGLIVEGSVGIGTTAPSNTIDINGTARIRSISASASAATIFLTTDANGVLVSRTAAQVRSDIGAGTGNGSVTSVNGTGTVSGITLSGTVTTSGNLTLGGTLSVTPSNFASQTANTFLAAPDGAAGVPTFRAMVSADIPNDGIVTTKILNSNVTLAKIQNIAISTVLGNSSASAAQAPVEINMTTLATMLSGKTMDIVGNATNVTGVVAIANGGTGTATTTANAFFVGPNGSSGAPSFRVMATADIPASIITFAKIQDVAGPTLIGRISATAGPVAALSSANARTVIGATTVGSNLITLPDISVSDKFLRVNFADNTVSALDAAAFRTAIGAGTGNGTVTSVTGSGGLASSGGTTPDISIATDGVTTAKILNSNVTYAKIQNVSATSRILGRISANAGVIEELTGANVATIIGANAIENATNVSITTDDSTNSSYYLYFGANASGNTALKASTKIRYNPNSGAFSATTKSFRIPHPTKSQHDLVYGSLESPYHGIRLTGKGKTSGNRAEIILPDYINVLVDKETIHIQLTPIKCAKILYIDDIIINDNKFIVKYDKSWYEKSKDVEFYWDFTAERKDVPKLIVEEKI